MRDVVIVLGIRDRGEEAYGAFYESDEAARFQEYLESVGVHSRRQTTNLFEYPDADHREIQHKNMYRP